MIKILQENMFYRPDDKSGDLARRAVEIQAQFRKEFTEAASYEKL